MDKEAKKKRSERSTESVENLIEDQTDLEDSDWMKATSFQKFIDKIDRAIQAKMVDITSFSTVAPVEKEFLHDGHIVPNQSEDALNLIIKEKPLIKDGVKIQPGCMIFKDAYDGKSYNQPLTITNCRKTSVNIRIFAPTSKAFKIKPMPIGHILSPGLSVVRHIKYLYTKPTAIPQACMDIYINNECIRYELLVTTCYPQISVFPKIVDFGDIDIGGVSDVKKITITNSGTKQAQYSTDLGRNQLEIVVEPIKGTVQPGESKEMTVEVFGTSEGDFNQEFWIKSDPLQRVHIQGRFIQPSLKVDYPWADNNILILSFSRTFVGINQERSVVIQNNSSNPAVCCVYAKTKDEKLLYKSALEKDINFKQFEIMPLEGRLHRGQKYIMRITYKPRKPKSRVHYYICNAIVDVRKCRAGGNPCSKQKSVSPENQSTAQAAPLLDFISVSTVMEDSYGVPQEIMVLNDVITIVLYGEVELPNVTIEPDGVNLTNLIVNDTHVETLKILNNSKTLPLIMKFNKVTSIEMEPKTLILPPSEQVEAALKLRPTKMGDSLAKLVLDLFYQQKQELFQVGTISINLFYSAQYTREQKLLHRRKPSFLPGITPNNLNEVGYLVDDVRFNTEIEKPIMTIVDKKLLAFNKNDDALVAFPNDMPKILKPWRNANPCKTIFAQLPRLITDVDVDYDLTPNQQFLKETKESYYRNYLQSLSKKRHPRTLEEEFEDYVTTNEKRILMEHVKNASCPAILRKGNNKQSLFAPLTPYEIHNIVVSPKFIQLGRLGADTECSDHFSIENKNDFAIHLSIKSLYTSIRIIQEEFILGPNSQKGIDFVYHSDRGGTHHMPMFIILNFFHVVDVTVLATIVANAVQCLTKDICIVPTEKTCFLELRNPINSDVSFEVDTNYFHLESFPPRGVIPAKRNMILTITFNPEVGFSPMKEISIISESGTKELVEVSFDHKKASVSISTETLKFKDIPLNTEVTQELIIVNNSDQLVPVNVEFEDDRTFPEMTVKPMKALIWQKGDMVIAFTLKFKEMVEFKIPINLTFQYKYSRQIMVTGNVVYPNINFKPELIKIQKIPCGSVVKTPFKVTNNSESSNYVLFPMQDYPEFSIKTRQGENITAEILTLAPKEKRDLLLEFQPQERVAYCIYLPYIINGSLGPPELNCAETLQSSYYLNSVKDEYKKSIEQSSMKLKVLKILCAAGSPWLKFNSLHLEFCSLEKTCDNFEFTNISQTTLEVFLKAFNIEPFNITSTSENVQILDKTIKATLEPEDTCTVSLEFTPESYGKFSQDIPIFIEDYSEVNVFNCLSLTGNNPEPEIISNEKSIYFIPTYPDSKQSKKIILDLIAHKCNKEVEVTYDCPEVEISFISQDTLSEVKTIVQYIAIFAPKSECTIETQVTFSCSCSTSTRLDIFACCDHAFVINFMSAPSILQKSTYPLFPSEDDTSEYAQLLKSIAAIIERWLYNQGFFHQNYYRVPEDIARYPVQVNEKQNKAGSGKKSFRQLPLVQLLINLMDTSILKYIDNGILPSQDLQQRTLYNYVTYRNTLSFLKSQGIQVPGLKPEYLLAYIEYVEYKNNLAEKELTGCCEDFTKQAFYRFSKQKWLDLFFHIYKVLVQERTVNPRQLGQLKPEQNEFILKDKENFTNYLEENLHRFPNWYYCDAKLLLWLEYHYNREKIDLWPKEKFETIQYLEDFANVDDSVSLATVTAAYCPYLKDHLRDIYVSPKNVEQRVHNACKVVQSWKSLKLSLDVHPQMIVTANKVKVILIVTYLYEVLPNFYPTNEVVIEAPLSESASYKLNVQNCGQVPVQYVTTFFGESSDLFTLDCNSFSIPPSKTKSMKLTYFAKKVLDASTILVLSGEAGGQRYAKSMAVTITGVPLTTSSDEIKLTVETYKNTKKKIELKTPYGKNYRAKIFICFEEPKSYKDLHCVDSIKRNYIPREIDVVQTECEFADKGAATITLATCFLHQGPSRFYLYFCNDDVGDFCVLINVISALSKSKTTTIYVELPQNFKMKCTCRRGFNHNCPKAFSVNIPSKNEYLWDSTGTLIQNCFSDSTYQGLKNSFGTPMVFRIMKFYLERFPQGFMLPSCIFDDEGEFTIKENSNYSSPMATFKISDTTADQTVPLVLHWNQSSRPTQASLELRRTNEKEVRFYKLIFPPEEDSGISSGSHSEGSLRSNASG